MINDDYIRIRCTSMEKLVISARAAELGLTMTDYILRACAGERNSGIASEIAYVPIPKSVLAAALGSGFQPGS